MYIVFRQFSSTTLNDQPQRPTATANRNDYQLLFNDEPHRPTDGNAQPTRPAAQLTSTRAALFQEGCSRFSRGFPIRRSEQGGIRIQGGQNRLTLDMTGKFQLQPGMTKAAFLYKAVIALLWHTAVLLGDPTVTIVVETWCGAIFSYCHSSYVLLLETKQRV